MNEVTGQGRGTGRLQPALMRGGVASILALAMPAIAFAQAIVPAPAGVIQLPTVFVVAQKEPADARTLPISVTTVSAEWLRRSGISFIGEAAMFAPNTYFTEFSARKLSFPRFRGIGSSPSNPGVATYIDGVPQLNTNSTNLELLDVEQVEFVRGPESALFGRNALGGLVNVTTGRPSLTGWAGLFEAPFGSDDTRELRAHVSGPLRSDTLGMSFAMGYGRRDGFTRNDVTGRLLDARSAFSAKGQLFWAPTSTWHARLIVAGERARDGDYAFNDLAALRERPFRAARDFEGFTRRDLMSTTVESRYQGRRVSITTSTGIVRWKTDDSTDLDYTALPAATRRNEEDDVQFTQEVRLASIAPSPIGGHARMKWQAGAFFLTQGYEQDAVNTFAPLMLSSFIPFALRQHSPEARLDDVGFGLYGQTTVTLHERLDVSGGARLDHERKKAALRTFWEPGVVLIPDVVVNADRRFTDVSPQIAAAFRADTQRTVYASVGRGFKAGGFNPASPAGSESYGQEHAWHYEGGLKALWAGGRMSTNVAAFYIDWQDLQLNVPNPQVPGQFYIANAGGATSKGLELELNARVRSDLDLFAVASTNRARFQTGTMSVGLDVSGRKLPLTPDYQFTIGARGTRAIGAAAIYAGAEAVFYGAFQYDDANTAAQSAYSLANARGGIRGKRLFAEAWIRNAFDTRYIPIAFAFPGFAPSGFVGEMGRPRTFGVSGGVRF